MEAPIERLRFASWRQNLAGRIAGPTALEVGVGTGKNLIFCPDNVDITAIDLSPRMLERANKSGRMPFIRHCENDGIGLGSHGLGSHRAWGRAWGRATVTYGAGPGVGPQ
jgi:SAM-dependent methyltransferase